MAGKKQTLKRRKKRMKPLRKAARRGF